MTAALPPIPTESSSASLPKSQMEKLNELLQCAPQGSKIAEIFKSAKESGQISEETYLPWESSFHGGTGYIDNITSTDVKLPVMWGISPMNHLFIVVKTSCQTESNKKLEICTLFPREPESIINFKVIKSGAVDILWPEDPYFQNNLVRLLRGEVIKDNEKEYSLLKLGEDLQSDQKFIRLELSKEENDRRLKEHSNNTTFHFQKV